MEPGAPASAVVDAAMEIADRLRLAVRSRRPVEMPASDAACLVSALDELSRRPNAQSTTTNSPITFLLERVAAELAVGCFSAAWKSLFSLIWEVFLLAEDRLPVDLHDRLIEVELLLAPFHDLGFEERAVDT